VQANGVWCPEDVLLWVQSEAIVVGNVELVQGQVAAGTISVCRR
jgi:hypothetical protein